MAEVPVIEISQLRKFYRGKYRGIDGLNPEVYPSEVFGFLGPNGAGKTEDRKVIEIVVYSPKPSQSTTDRSPDAK